MILSFKCKYTEMLFNDIWVKKFSGIEKIARRKLLILHRSKNLTDLNSPPGNKLELLKGDRINQYSIRINDQWRICFIWQENQAYEVEIVDYH
jgi:proteic killer suppression protein